MESDMDISKHRPGICCRCLENCLVNRAVIWNLPNTRITFRLHRCAESVDLLAKNRAIAAADDIPSLNLRGQIWIMICDEKGLWKTYKRMTLPKDIF
jgi:hypothetical protein